MRTTTAPELAVLTSLNRRVTPRFKVQNGSGTMIDLTTWLENVKPDEDIDRPIAGLTFEFRRDNGTTQSFSPLRTDSVLNRLDDGVTYSPVLDLNRIVTYEVATTAFGAPILDGDYKMLFKGTIDTINFEASPVTVVCRDLGAPLVDRFVETEATYGTGGGRAIELVKQDILDASFGAGVVPVYTIGAPAFSITTYQQQKMSLSDAEQDLDQLRGWDSRYWWDSGTSTFRYTFQEPPRTKTTPDYTFGPKDYYSVRSLDLDLTTIKNVVQVSFRDSANLGNRTVITVSDAPSIAKYGRRFLYMREDDNSPIDTTAEATAMANAALSDLKEPKASLEIELPFFWPIQLWDLYRFLPNGKHFNTSQDLAVSSYNHDFTRGRTRTFVKLRGSPAGGYAIWLQRGGTIGGPTGGTGQAYAPYPYITALNTEASDATWDYRFNAVNGSGGGGTNLTFTIKSKATFGTESTLDSGNASLFPRSVTITRLPKNDQVITFTVTDAATGMFAEAITTVPAYVPAISATGTVIGAQIDAASVTLTQLASERAMVHKSTNTAVANATLTVVALDTDDYLSSNITRSSSKLTVAKAGNYSVTGWIVWEGNATGNRFLELHRKDSFATILFTRRVSAPAISWTTPAGTTGNEMLIAFVTQMAAGDSFSMNAYQDSGASRNITTAYLEVIGLTN